MQYSLCRHIKTNGSRCQAPSLSGGAWCYFHNKLYLSHNRYCRKQHAMAGHQIELHALEDSESVQVALSLVINALANGDLEAKRATALLYGLQLASRNAARLPAVPNPPNIVRSFALTPEGFEMADSHNESEQRSDEEERQS